jgi:hypothetical protein
MKISLPLSFLFLFACNLKLDTNISQKLCGFPELNPPCLKKMTAMTFIFGSDLYFEKHNSLGPIKIK